MEQSQEEREYLTAKDVGTWEVTTVGSVHIFDFDHLTYHRHNRDGLNPIEGDDDLRHFTPGQVIVWPHVGHSFAMIFPVAGDETLGLVIGTFRMSSEVQSIRRIA